MTSKKVLITGNKDYGLCKEICHIFDSVDNIDYTTASRSNGWELTNKSNQDNLADFFISEGFNVFINSSAMWKFNQTLLAETMYTSCEWRQKYRCTFHTYWKYSRYWC